jgi:hypothetical protein
VTCCPPQIVELRDEGFERIDRAALHIGSALPTTIRRGSLHPHGRLVNDLRGASRSRMSISAAG